MGNLFAVDHQTHQDLAAHRTPADIDMPQKPLVVGFVIGGDAVLVGIIDDRILDPVGLRRQDAAAAVLHHIMGARPEKAGIHPPLFAGYRVLGLVPVAMAVRCRQDGNLLQLLPRHPVQAGSDPFRLQSGLFFIVHVPEVAAAAELGNFTLPVDPVGGFLQNFRDFACGPGLAHRLNADAHPFPGDGIGDEHSDAVDVGNALALGGIIRDDRFVNLILFQHTAPSYSGNSIPIF